MLAAGMPKHVFSLRLAQRKKGFTRYTGFRKELRDYTLC